MQRTEPLSGHQPDDAAPASQATAPTGVQAPTPASKSAVPLPDDAAPSGVDAPACASSGTLSARVPDWSRERRRPGEWSPAKSLIASVRAYQRHAGRRGLLSFFARRLAVLRHRWWSVVSGADVPLTSRLGGGLMLPHPNGVVIHPGAVIGPNCMIFQQVTVGATVRGVPTLGGHVDIGAGAKILGGVRIGDHARIGANAVVLCDVPEGTTAVGVPAVVIDRATPATSTPRRQPDGET